MQKLIIQMSLLHKQNSGETMGKIAFTIIWEFSSWILVPDSFVLCFIYFLFARRAVGLNVSALYIYFF